MGQARLDPFIHIPLDLCPLFRFGGRVLGDQGAKVSGVDGGEDSAFGEGVKVVQDWRETRQERRFSKKCSSVLSSMAA